jgi:hypothetical protein
MVVQLLKKFSIFCNTKCHHRIYNRPLLQPIKSRPSHPISLRSFLVLSFHLHLGHRASILKRETILTCIRKCPVLIWDFPPAIPSECFRDFPQSLQPSIGVVPRITSFQILSNSIFTDYPIIRRHIVRDTDSVVKQTTHSMIFEL